MVNNGNVTTNGIDSSAIFELFATGTLQNNGTLNVNNACVSTGSEDYGIGIYAGQNLTITNSGTILANGTFTTGIFSAGNSIAIANLGSIQQAVAEPTTLASDALDDTQVASQREPGPSWAAIAWARPSNSIGKVR